MIQRLLIAALTVLVFGAGYLVRTWTDDDLPVPAPPLPLGSEFSRGPAAVVPFAKGAAKAQPREFEQPVNRAALITDIEKARPQIEVYRRRLDELDAEFDRALASLLNAEQLEKFAARQKRLAERRVTREAHEAADPSPLSDEQILRLQQMPLFNVLWSITISARLERLNRDLKLDAPQQARAHELLLARRDKFLALVDSSPPPTVTLSLLASRAQKVSAPPARAK